MNLTAIISDAGVPLSALADAGNRLQRLCEVPSGDVRLAPADRLLGGEAAQLVVLTEEEMAAVRAAG